MTSDQKLWKKPVLFSSTKTIEIDSHDWAERSLEAGEWQVHKVYTEGSLDVGEWQVLNAFPNYEINTKTLMLRNINTKHIPSLYTKEDSYQRVYLDGRYEYYHRVIALHFIPNPDPEKYTEVNHKNHIRNDNRFENLEWCTISDNRKDRRTYTRQKKRFVKELPEGCYQ